MRDDNNNQDDKVDYIFGKLGYIHSYALININDEDEQTLVGKFREEGGVFLTLNDGTGVGFLFNLSSEQIINIVLSYPYINAFIYGENSSPSTPCFYTRNDNGCYESVRLETIVSYFDLEVIAPTCCDIWEDLNINDFFQESLFTYLDDCEGSEDECE